MYRAQATRLVKHQLGIALFLLFAMLALGCKRNAAPGTTSTSSTPTPDLQQAHNPEGGTTSAPITKFFEGSIGSTLGLQMKLVRDGTNLTGSYFYRKVGTKINLKGTVDLEGNLMLEELDTSNKVTGVFRGLWKTNEDGLINLVGNWSKPNSDKKTAFSIHEQPIEFTGATEIVAKTIKSSNKSPKYEIDADYPQIIGAADTRFDKFNLEARNLVNRKVAEFRKDIVKRVEEMPTVDMNETGSDLSIGYSVGFASDELISVEFGIGGYYAGAAHPNSYTEVINYDAKNGKILKLADLFKSGAKYLQAVSAYAIKDLKAQGKAQGADSMLTDETIQEGAGPQIKNFRSWTITRKGLALAFDSYQVAPYAAGPQSVLIPYSALKDLVNPDGPIGRFVK
jgi:hypothetical protein